MIQRHTYCFSEAMNEPFEGQALHLETTRREGETPKTSKTTTALEVK